MAELIIDRPYPAALRRAEPEEDIIARTRRENSDRVAAEAAKRAVETAATSAQPHWDAD